MNLFAVRVPVPVPPRDASPAASQMLRCFATVNAIPDSVTSSMMRTPSNSDEPLPAAMSADSSGHHLHGHGHGHGNQARLPPAAPQRNRRYHRRNNMNRNNFFRSNVQAVQVQADGDSSMDNLQALQHDMGSDAIESSSSFGMADASTPTERLHRSHSHSLSLEVPRMQMQMQRRNPAAGRREDGSSTDIDLTGNQ